MLISTIKIIKATSIFDIMPKRKADARVIRSAIRNS